MTIEIIDNFGAPISKFPLITKTWRMSYKITHNFDQWVKDTFPEIIDVNRMGGYYLEGYPAYRYTFKSEAHYTWFLLQQ
jgi:hypothetical protein